jgi:hypothetical protein
MNKRKIIIITMISTIVSLLIILLTYFGIIRYAHIRMHTSSDKQIENYSKLDKHEGEGKIIISTSTTPDRIDKMRPMVNSILDQTVKVDEIYLIIQQDKKYNVPEYMRKVFRIFPFGKDYGKEGNKIIPILFKEKECNTTIIALNDNVVYGKDFIQTMLEERDKNPGVVLIDSKNTSLLIRPEYYGCEILKRDRDTYDEKWFLENTKNSKIINYNENYKAF